LSTKIRKQHRIFLRKSRVEGVKNREEMEKKFESALVLRGFLHKVEIKGKG